MNTSTSRPNRFLNMTYLQSLNGSHSPLVGDLCVHTLRDVSVYRPPPQGGGVRVGWVVCGVGAVGGGTGGGGGEMDPKADGKKNQNESRFSGQ